MKRITQKMLTTFIAEVADRKPSSISDDDAMCYYSKIDGSYFTREGMEGGLKFLLKKGITKQLQSASGKPGTTVSIGFNPDENKWYGWSHRAIYGFTIGSRCKKGDCHYQAADKEDFIEDCERFWYDDEHHKGSKAEECTDKDGVFGVEVSWTYSNAVPNKDLHGTTSSHFTPYPETFGKGEWTAKTMEEAKQMAVDFAEGVS